MVSELVVSFQFNLVIPFYFAWYTVILLQLRTGSYAWCKHFKLTLISSQIGTSGWVWYLLAPKSMKLQNSPHFSVKFCLVWIAGTRYLFSNIGDIEMQLRNVVRGSYFISKCSSLGGCLKEWREFALCYGTPDCGSHSEVCKVFPEKQLKIILFFLCIRHLEKTGLRWTCHQHFYCWIPE